MSVRVNKDIVIFIPSRARQNANDLGTHREFDFLRHFWYWNLLAFALRICALGISETESCINAKNLGVLLLSRAQRTAAKNHQQEEDFTILITVIG